MKYFTACLLLSLALAVSGEEATVPHVTIQTNFGPFEIELNPAKAPESVENFLIYVKEGFYEGTIFHRVINNFVVQTGGYTADFKKKDPHPSIPNEAANGLKNLRSTVAMARSAEPHSANSQFFINVKENKFLDYKSSTPSGWGYCVFGKVVEGMEVIDKIAQLPTDAGGPFKRDVPQTQVTIQAVKIEYVPPTDWVSSASVPDKPAATDKQKDKSEASTADVQQEPLSTETEDNTESAKTDKNIATETDKHSDTKTGKESKEPKKEPKDTVTKTEAKHNKAITEKRSVAEMKKEKTDTSVADKRHEMSSMDGEEPENVSSEPQKTPVMVDKQSESKAGKEAKVTATAKSKDQVETKTDKKSLSDKQKNKQKSATADDMQEDMDPMDMRAEEQDIPPKTDNRKPAETDKPSEAKNSSKETKVTTKTEDTKTKTHHQETKAEKKSVSEQKNDQPEPSATDEQQEDMSSMDAEEDEAHISSVKKMPADTVKKTETKAGKESKVANKTEVRSTKTTAETKANSEKSPSSESETEKDTTLETESVADTSKKTVLKENASSKGVGKSETSLKSTAKEESSSQAALKDDDASTKIVANTGHSANATSTEGAVKVMKEKDTPIGTKAATSVNKSSGKGTLPPDPPTPPDKPEPAAY